MGGQFIPNAKVVAIGGGEILSKQTLPIDRFIVKYAGVSKPNVLFVPTAADDAPLYIKAVRDVYLCELGCRFDTLELVAKDVSQNEAAEKIAAADIVYVGGGSTKRMIDVWATLGIEKLMRLACQRGAVMCGLSAGAICWFSYGHSDSVIVDGKCTMVAALGWYNAIYCPHYNEDNRKDFSEMVGLSELNGIAVDSNCALVIDGETAYAIQSADNAGAYMFIHNGADLNKISLDIGEKYNVGLLTGSIRA